MPRDEGQGDDQFVANAASAANQTSLGKRKSTRCTKTTTTTTTTTKRATRLCQGENQDGAPNGLRTLGIADSRLFFTCVYTSLHPSAASGVKDVREGIEEDDDTAEERTPQDSWNAYGALDPSLSLRWSCLKSCARAQGSREVPPSAR